MLGTTDIVFLTARESKGLSLEQHLDGKARLIIYSRLADFIIVELKVDLTAEGNMVELKVRH